MKKGQRNEHLLGIVQELDQRTRARDDSLKEV